MPSSTSRMKYKRLDPYKNDIRVLRFLSNPSSVSIEDLIQCSIENVPLQESLCFQSHQMFSKNEKNRRVWDVFTKYVDLRDSTLEQTTLDEVTSLKLSQNHEQSSNTRYDWGDFEALSYTWGEEYDTRSILVNGIRRDVPKNLEAALRALRDLKETRLGMRYWVDYLCIDQDNEKERNEQVKRMREIYGRARAVVVWLGEEEKSDRIAVQTMRHLCRNPCVKNTLKLPGNLLLHGWDALVNFMQKPYWNRSWIIQELAMNHNSTLILCGKSKLTRRMIRLGAIFCQEWLKVTDFEEQFCQSTHCLESDAWAMASRVHRLTSLYPNSSVEVSLDLLLNIIRGADATDKKDKVYSILGLLDSAVSAGVVPDYSLSVPQVYSEFIRSIIAKSGRLEQIMFGGIPAQPGWPSWVPDWRLPFQRRHVRYLRSRQASGNLGAKIRFLHEGKFGDLLACGGFHVDIVDGVAAQHSSGGYFSQSRNASSRYGSQILKALKKTLLMDHPGATGDLLFEVPWLSSCGINHSSLNSRLTSKWPELLQSSYYREYHNFRKQNEKFCIGGQYLQDFFPESGKDSADTAAILRCIRLALLSLKQRALITTKTGYLGLAPESTRPGDVVAILLGCNCPVVLRPYNHNLYHLIGECYVHGLMDGEILSQENGGADLEREFVLY